MRRRDDAPNPAAALCELRQQVAFLVQKAAEKLVIVMFIVTNGKGGEKTTEPDHFVAQVGVWQIRELFEVGNDSASTFVLRVQDYRCERCLERVKRPTECLRRFDPAGVSPLIEMAPKRGKIEGKDFILACEKDNAVAACVRDSKFV